MLNAPLPTCSSFSSCLRAAIRMVSGSHNRWWLYWSWYLVLLFGSGSLTAQEARVHGRVTNAEGVPLEAATVTAVGAVINALTDAEGEYELEVAAGKVRLVVTYIGLENFDTTFQVALADRDLRIDVQLNNIFSDLPETQVIGRRTVGQAQALRLQQSGLCTQTIIHSEVFNKYPDVTLAETVSRMPGVSVVRDVSGGQLVQLRGLPERYTAVALNGQRLPNVQPEDDQSGGLDLIQSSLVEEVRIIKSRTADLDGDAIAGLVDFRIRQPEERFELLAQAAQGANYGFADNPGQFGGVTQLAGALNSEVSEEKVFALAAGSYLREGRGVRHELFEFAPGTSVPSIARPFDENILTERIGFVGAVELRPSTFNRMRLSVNQSIVRRDLERRQLYLPLDGSERFRRTGSAYSTSRRVSLVALEVENNFPRTRLDYQLSFNDTQETVDGRRRGVQLSDAPPQHPFMADALTPFTDLGGQTREAARLQQDAELQETLALGSLNLTRWLNEQRTANLKIGTRYRSKDRRYGSVGFQQAIANGATAANSAFLPLLTERPQPIFPDPGTAAGQLYDARQRIAAAYLMYSVNVNAQFSLNAGVRFEYLEVETRNNTDTFRLTRTDWLPSLNAVYRLRRDRQLRLSFYEALGRPNYGNFRPAAKLPLLPLDEFSQSNQPLEYARSQNIDLTWERYGRRDGLLTAGVYFKTIDHPIVRLRETQDSLRTFSYLTRPVNTSAASVVGLEVALYQSLGAIDQRWRNFNVNATWNFNFLSTQGTRGLSNEAPLAQAPRQTANLSIVYTAPERRINFVLAGNYRDRFFDYFLDDQPVWRNNLFSLDLSADYAITRQLSVFVRANNLTNHPLEEWLGRPGRVESRQRSRARYGSWGLIGVRFAAR